MNESTSGSALGGSVARAAPRVVGLLVGLALMRGADLGVWFYLGVAVFVGSLPLANPVAWWHYVRTGQGPPLEAEYAEGGDFRVELRAPGPRAIEVVKAVREVTGAGLVEAKSKVDTTPSTVVAGLSEASAGRVRARLERAGANATVAEGPSAT
jgi:ribosomal protein L7/L12